MDKKNIARLILDVVGPKNIKIDEPMKKHTSFKIGGPADVFVTPSSPEQLAGIINICMEHGIPKFIMGNGSNLVVRDKGIRGIVIKLSDNFNKCSAQDDIIYAEAGILLSKVANFAAENDLGGLEFASGIPGSLGGAVAMNAGAYGGEMKDVVISTEYMDENGRIFCAEGEEHQFGYRSSFVQSQKVIVLSCKMKLKKGNFSEIKSLMSDLNQRRKDKQPLEMPSAGSVFKRPNGFFTGKLIEDCGLKGFRIGGAEVSSKHCGFIVNADNATASDVINLITYVQGLVKESFGVELKTEVRIVGEE